MSYCRIECANCRHFITRERFDPTIMAYRTDLDCRRELSVYHHGLCKQWERRKNENIH